MSVWTANVAVAVITLKRRAGRNIGFQIANQHPTNAQMRAPRHQEEQVVRGKWPESKPKPSIHERHGLELDLDQVELLVVRPEVVAPLTTTVHLVDDDPLEPVLLVRLLKLVQQGLRLHKLLRRDVQQLERRVRVGHRVQDLTGPLL